MKTMIATVKSFIKKNRKNLYVKVKSNFNGMTDSVEQVEDTFTPAEDETRNQGHTMGILGAWFVGHGRDYHEAFSAEGFTGFKVFNSCGSFIVAIKSAV